MTLGQWLIGIKNKISEKVSKSGDVMTGSLSVPDLYISNGSAETTNIDSITNGYKYFFVDISAAHGGTHPPADSGHYYLMCFGSMQIAVEYSNHKMWTRGYTGSQWESWADASGDKVSRAGDTITGALEIHDSENQVYTKNDSTDLGLALNNDNDGSRGLRTYDEEGAGQHWIIEENSDGEVSVPIKNYDESVVFGSAVSTAPSRYEQIYSTTFPSAGIYLVDWCLYWESNSNGEREIAYSTSATISSDPSKNLCDYCNANKTWGTPQHLITIINVTSPTQVHYLHGYQNSGSSLTVQGSCKYVRLGSV